MAKISLAGFKDPVRRPRFIVWTFVVVLALAAFVVVMLGATSTRWFCAEVCHKVQDDTIAAYNASSHAEISCMACHEPVNADTVTFLIAKVKSGLEVIPTVGNTFSLPLNPGSALALKGGKEMGSQQCTQCHSTNRKVSPDPGLIIDHKVHADAGIWCTVCHNRVAHNDAAVAPVLVAPNGTKNVVHPELHADGLLLPLPRSRGQGQDDRYRCEGRPGRLHHVSPGRLRAQARVAQRRRLGRVAAHGEKAKEILTEMGVAGAEAKKLEEEGIAPYLAAPVNECFTCHVETKFCNTCHDKLKVTTTP